MVYQKINLLIVEDNKGDARLIEEQLKYSSIAKFIFIKAATKADAFEKLKEHDVDIILLDLNLPDSTGIDTFNHFSNSFPDVPIVVLTGNDNPELGEEAVKKGAQDFLVKGYVTDLLLARILCFSIERYKSQQRIKESEKRFRMMVEKNIDATIIADKTGVMLYVNPSAEKLFSNSSANMLGKMFGYPIVEKESTEIEIVQDNQIKKIAEMRVVETEWESKNAFLIMLSDITEQKKIDEIIKTERQRFNDVLEMLPAYVVLLTQDYYVRHSNRFFRDRFGNDDGKRCYEFLFGLNKPCQNCETFNVFKSSRPQEWEWTGPDLRNYYIYDFPFTDADGTELIMEMGVDITDQKRAEQEVRQLNDELEKRVQRRTAELEVSNKELEAFSYSVSHDLRAHLAIIDSFAKFLRNDFSDKIDDRGKDYLNRIVSVSDRMASLMVDILNLSKISRLELQTQNLFLDEIAGKIIDDLKKADSSREVDVIIQQNMNIHADCRLLEIVMENLLNNAWKFTRYVPGAKIQIGMERQDGGNVYFVKDNGAGFDMKFIDNLFLPFKRLHDNKSFEGTGVGLATVKRIINKHGGKIWAESQVNKGAAFFFTLP